MIHCAGQDPLCSCALKLLVKKREWSPSPLHSHGPVPYGSGWGEGSCEELRWQAGQSDESFSSWGRGDGTGGAENHQASPHRPPHSARWRRRSAGVSGRAGARFASRGPQVSWRVGLPVPGAHFTSCQKSRWASARPRRVGHGFHRPATALVPRRAPSLSAARV